MAALLGAALASHANTTNFYTGFEPSEGYSVGAPLVGAHGWVATLPGTSGSGIMSNVYVLDGTTNILWGGQQAYIGYSPVAGASLTLWQPLTPITANATNVTFST
jgi:hypothetical protein